MHGVILYALKKFVEDSHGARAWLDLVARAGLDDPFYVPTEAYPDEHAHRLVAAASAVTGAPAADICVAFGRSLVPRLMSLYGSLVREEWKTLEFLLNTEEMIHRVLRMNDEKAQPPHLRVDRVAADEVTVVYDSARRLCAVARGLIEGVAAHYGERVVITEPQCMLRGDEHCLLSVRRQ
jgi:predicted hydrocarbon binding protein